MSLLDKILNLFKPGSPKTFESLPNKEIEIPANADKNIIISSGKSKIRYVVKYTTTMINTITLSSDMKTLFLIDNGRAISFPIDTVNGVLIGSIKGQITVATALTQDEEEGGAAEGGEGARTRAANYPVIKLEVATKQWTLTYTKRSGIMSIIGATEIDSSVREDQNCEEHRVNLNDSVVKINRKAEEILLTVLPK